MLETLSPLLARAVASNPTVAGSIPARLAKRRRESAGNDRAPPGKLKSPIAQAAGL